MTEPVTFTERYTSLKSLYKSMIFPKNPDTPKWTLTEVDQLDVHFFYELVETEEVKPQEKEVYLSSIW